MRYVLDASVGLKTVLPEPDTLIAQQVVINSQNQLHELIAPDTYLVECSHGLVRAERKRVIRSDEVLSNFQIILKSSPLLHHHVALLPRAIQLATLLRHGVYDCLYVALAEQEQCQLITADKRLAQNYSDAILLSSL